VDDEARPRVLSIMGGKLTTYRATAQKALLRLMPSLPTKERRADTALVALFPVD
jgi:glycerol-3-phosphate dehydrogenase